MTTDPPNKFSFEDLIHHLPCMVYVCKNDFDWTMLFVSKGGEALTEYKSEELENNATISYGKLIHPNDRTIVWDSVQKAILQREPYQIIYRIITRLGKEKWVWERGCPIFDENNELIVLEGCIFDITSKITSERELAAQEERWRKAFEVSEIGVWDFDVLKGKVFFNSSWFSMLGYELYEIPDNINLFWNLVHDEDRSCIEEKFTSLVKGYESVFECKFRLKTRSGDWQWVYSHAHVVEKDQHGQPLRIIGVQFDITDEVDKERRRVAAELEIRKKQNFESLGLLAGGVAHNFNNLLMIVRGNIELLQCFLKDSSEALG